MWSLEQIRAMNADAGIMARGKRLKPYKLNDEDQINGMPPFQFPNFGDEADRMDEEYERVDSLFCDSSGFGSPSEPALTNDQLKSKLRRLLLDHGELLLAIESVGQFQLYIGVWKNKEE